MTLPVLILLDGVLYAAVLFLLAAGLTLIYGVMRILNIAHGSFYALGAYAGTTLVLAYLAMREPGPLMYLALLVGGLLAGVVVLLGIRATRLGRMIVAVTADREISATLGINVGRLFTLAFTVGAILATLGGALIGPLIAVSPGISVEAIVLAFAVVVIGGLGSLEGAALGALIVGVTRAAAVHLLPEAELATVYLIMVAVLLFRPRGLFGELEMRRI
ncbi:MAG TPA: branched-chain amino acid ABC transporter permease [Methylomirabilota bacterium]|nr:branched-chain amino acid ABC transporter permease [Methylomirabilota bacterium]